MFLIVKYTYPHSNRLRVSPPSIHRKRIGPSRLRLGLFLIGFGVSSISFGNELPLISHIMEDIRILSGPRFQGRQAGTAGGEQAANFVVQRFQTLGLHPAFTDKEESSGQWRQQSSVTASQIFSPVHLAFFPIGRLTIHNPLLAIPGKDFLPIFDSPSVNLTAPVIFVGYGIVDPARGIHDYQGENVQNRVVLALRGKPPGYSPWITQEEKAQTAKEHGAAGFITLTGPILNSYDSRKGLGQTPLAIYFSTPETRPIPGVWIDGKLGENLFQSIGLSLQRMQLLRNEPHTIAPQTLPLIAHLQWTSQSGPGTLTNVLGVLPGQDTGQQNDIIIVGAHRDHFGEQAGLPFPGADDNASGTAVMLELARILSQRRTPLTRTIVFASFDGEERGLLGSTLYVNNPVFPLGRTIAMINLDHVGVGSGKLTVGVTRLDTSLVQQATDLEGLGDRIQMYGYFPGGDHVPFFEAEVPTITIVSSGVHPHFHQPSDTADTIQPEILEITSRFLIALLTLLSQPF